MAFFVEGYVYAERKSEIIPLKLFWNGTRADNFTTATTRGASDAKRAGYRDVRVEGFAYHASKSQ